MRRKAIALIWVGAVISLLALTMMMFAMIQGSWIAFLFNAAIIAVCVYCCCVNIRIVSKHHGLN